MAKGICTRVPRWIAGLVLFGGLFCAPAFAAHPKIFIQSSAHVEVLYYSPAHEYLVTHLIRSYENALNFENNLFHYTPSQKLSVLLEDFGDYGHGAAGTVPSNFIDVGIAPFSYTYETLPANERMTWIMNHESIHIVMGDNSNSIDRRFRSLFFGKVVPTDEDPVSIFYSSMTSPRHYATRWFHEGIATFMETWMAGGLGRAMGGWDEMVFRTMVRDDAYIYDVVGLESEGTSADFQTGANSYLYGTRFMTWLCYTYGPDKLLEWITRGENTKRYFGSRFKQVYGIGMNEAWKMWIAEERKFQEANLADIRKYPVTMPQRLTPKTLGSVSRAYFDPKDNVIYAGIRYPAHMASIAAIHVDTGKIEELKDIKGPALYYVTSLAWDPRGRKLYYTTDNNDLRDLNVYDVETHHSARLLKDIRTGDLAFDAADSSLWGVRHNNGLSALVEFPAPYKEMTIRRDFEYGNDLFDIDVSPDGQYLTGAISDVSGKQKLVRFRIDDLRKRAMRRSEVLYDFEYNSPGNFVYSPDGRYLYGSSYYTGASNLFRYDFETKKMDVISNAETGLFRPLPLADGSLIAFEYTSKGFVPARVPTEAAGRRERGEVLRPGHAGQISGAAEVEAAAALFDQLGESDYARGLVRSAAQRAIDLGVSDRARLQEHRRRGHARRVCRSFAHGGRELRCQLFARSEPAGERARAPLLRRAHVGLEADRLLQLRRFLRSVRSHQAKPQRRIAEAGAFAILDLRHAAHALARLERRPVIRISTRCRSIKTSSTNISETCWMRTWG